MKREFAGQIRGRKCTIGLNSILIWLRSIHYRQFIKYHTEQDDKMYASSYYMEMALSQFGADISYFLPMIALGETNLKT